MSLRAIESAIASEARVHFNNPKLRVKDLMEWSSAEIVTRPGEVVARLPLNGVWVAIEKVNDKRRGMPGKEGWAGFTPQWVAFDDGLEGRASPATAADLARVKRALGERMK